VQAQRWSGSIALPIFNLRVSSGCVVNAEPLTLSPGKEQVSIVREGEWDPGPICTGAEKKSLSATGVRKLDRPVRSE